MNYERNCIVHRGTFVHNVYNVPDEATEDEVDKFIEDKYDGKKVKTVWMYITELELTTQTILAPIQKEE
ncbi:MAG: hypothetical protein ACW987_15500 [Candidatus Thorarchaeota archaeon]